MKKIILAFAVVLSSFQIEAQVKTPAPSPKSTVEQKVGLTDVTIEYPKRGRQPAFTAVKNFNLEIYPGEIVGLVGESGSGKTSSIKALCEELKRHPFSVHFKDHMTTTQLENLFFNEQVQVLHNGKIIKINGVLTYETYEDFWFKKL
jgi:ABC-type dipeptide/oligopeptide/nickel transport system ATPase subunit